MAELDRCVKCGMCLPECPTYRLEATENESPRGRLALIEGLVKGRLQADAPLIRHLDNCLTCRRCERVCPSQVRYGFLIDQARVRLAAHPPGKAPGWMHNPTALRWGTQLARALPTALSRPFGRLHRMHLTARALPATRAAPRAGTYPSLHAAARGTVGLFAGCTGDALQGGALHAAVALLQHSGFDVSVPPQATCCGALSWHAGDAAGAARLTDATRAAFDHPLDAVISIASGCGNQLDAYQPALRAPHRDICRFLLEHGGLGPRDLRPLAQQVLLHTPCSVENVYRGGHWAAALLQRIPQLEVVAVGETGQCCGAAGDYMLRHAAAAARLRQPIVDAAAAAQARILLTGNIGCAMHLAAGLRQAGSEVEVLHPVELLARQLRGRAGEDHQPVD
jgi:glycolate oxidase iron-sulfur subunit